MGWNPLEVWIHNFYFFTHLHLQRLVFFIVSHPLPTYHLICCLSLPSSFSHPFTLHNFFLFSLGPFSFILFFSFHSSIFFSFFFFYFVYLCLRSLWYLYFYFLKFLFCGLFVLFNFILFLFFVCVYMLRVCETMEEEDKSNKKGRRETKRKNNMKSK